MKKFRLATLSIIIVMLAVTVAMQSCCNSEESLDKYKGWRVYDIKERGRKYITVSIDSAGEIKKVYTKIFFKTKYPVGSVIGEETAQTDVETPTEDQAAEQPIENETEPEKTQE